MEFIREFCDITLDINIRRKGIFKFINEGSTGKSYLALLLNDLNLPQFKVISYENDDNIFNYKVDRALLDKGVELILLDRADMYMTQELLDRLIDASKDKIIILDLKTLQNYNVCFSGICSIRLSQGRLRVFCV